MAKITRHGGPSIREFQSPATVLRRRGKLGPYGGESRVETFTTVEDDDESKTLGGSPEPAPEPEAGAGSGEPPKKQGRAPAAKSGSKPTKRAAAKARGQTGRG